MVVPLLLLAAPSHARATIRTEVVQAVAGKSFLAAVEIDTDPHWHVYWRNPGDSGVPTTIQWRAPRGWKVQPLEEPVPHRFAPGGIVAYGYEGKTLFLARITPTKTPGRVSASVKWLVCSDACIAGGATPQAAVRLGAHSVAGPWSARLRTAQAALPRTESGWSFRASRGGKGVTLRATPPMGKALPPGKPTFFPFETGLIDHAVSPVATVRAGGYVLQMKASPFPEGRTKLSGLLVAPSGATWPGGRTAVVVDAGLENGEQR